jgi:ABC-type transport system involved in cytochrome c biogenesis permease component
VLLLPIALPVVIAGAEATSAAFTGDPAGPWPAVLVAFALLSAGASALLAPAALEE